MLKLGCFILTIFASLASLAQCPSPPETFVLKTPADYHRTEEQAMGLMNCMINSPSFLTDKETEQAKAFCLVWLGGSPSITVHADTDVALFLDENPDYLYHYIFSLAIAEANFKEASLVFKEKEAIHLMALYDTKVNPKKRNSALKKFEKLYQKGKLITELEKIKNQTSTSN